MRQVEKTLVLSFSGDQAVSADGSIRAAWDDARNRAADGTVKTQFIPGDSAFFIVQADPAVRITRVLPTAGSVQAQGEVNRAQSDSLLFAAADQQQTLSWIPAGGISPRWYGNQGSGLQVSGTTITCAAGHPCRGDLAYTARCRSYRLQTPAVSLAKGQTWPVDVVIYYAEVI